ATSIAVDGDRSADVVEVAAANPDRVVPAIPVDGQRDAGQEAIDEDGIAAVLGVEGERLGGVVRQTAERRGAAASPGTGDAIGGRWVISGGRGGARGRARSRH